jgi:ABC-2 type transport system ATP-binding protein
MPGESAIRVEGLTKHYGEFPAVKGIDFQASAAEVFALLGPNGAGKTTTIRMLMGILQPTAGRAEIMGLDCFRDRPTIMRSVGYLPDEPLFQDFLRGREILRFVAEMHGLRAKDALARLGPLLEQLALAGDLEEFAVNYSHGMKKKLGLACALLHEPKVLILDEPTNGLDPFATRAVHGIIRQAAAAGGTVLLSTHLLDQAERLADRAGILHKGAIAAMGRLEELKRKVAQSATLEEVFFAVAGEGAAGDSATPATQQAAPPPPAEPSPPPAPPGEPPREAP